MTHDVIDRLLALQLLLAWAGEGLCEPPRLGFWPSDLVDPEGGGDLIGRLAPRTRRWASLEAALEAARQVDRARFAGDEGPGARVTLFRFGPSIDEALSSRLRARKRLGPSPEAQLPFLLAPEGALDRAALERVLALAAVRFEQEPGRRRIVLPPGTTRVALGEAAAMLAAAMVPLGSSYPAPYLEAEVVG